MVNVQKFSLAVLMTALTFWSFTYLFFMLHVFNAALRGCDYAVYLKS